MPWSSRLIRTKTGAVGAVVGEGRAVPVPRNGGRGGSQAAPEVPLCTSAGRWWHARFDIHQTNPPPPPQNVTNTRGTKLDD